MPVLAYRLSANYKVLLLEAGGGFNPMQAIPAMSLLLLSMTPFAINLKRFQ